MGERVSFSEKCTPSISITIEECSPVEATSRAISNFVQTGRNALTKDMARDTLLLRTITPESGGICFNVDEMSWYCPMRSSSVISIKRGKEKSRFFVLRRHDKLDDHRRASGFFITIHTSSDFQETKGLWKIMMEDNDQAVDVRANLDSVLIKINAAADSANRKPDDVTLVAVSKTHDARRIQPVINAGHRVFGENRVQEAEAKWPILKAKNPDITLHLIGPLQTNKVKAALELFDVIETVDRPKLAHRLANLMGETGFSPQLFIQVNTGSEPQKAGVLPQDADNFIRECVEELKLPVVGLMCIPPIEEEPSLHFALLRKIAMRNGLKNLSMGMSADYEVAIQFGATHVRVGTAIFGARPPASTE